MRVAVLTLCRDRVDYTRTCFASLRENAGCDYDHYVLDQGSVDGTTDWLLADESLDVTVLHENIGIARGLNLLLDEAVNPGDYDVIVKIDNDCELTQPDTLRDVCGLTLAGQTLLSPRILGLNNPPATISEFTIDGERILEVGQIGGIFLAAPAWVYDNFRFSETLPVWGVDDAELCGWFRRQGGRCGYVARLEAWHYETTNGQHAHYPEYFARTLAEGKPAL